MIKGLGTEQKTDLGFQENSSDVSKSACFFAGIVQGSQSAVLVQIKGKNAYLYRAADSEGNTIDFFVSEYRDKDVAKNSSKRLYPGQVLKVPVIG